MIVIIASQHCLTRQTLAGKGCGDDHDHADSKGNGYGYGNNAAAEWRLGLEPLLKYLFWLAPIGETTARLLARGQMPAVGRSCR